MKKLLVTGSAGFVGSNFVKFALDFSHENEIVGLDSLSHMGDSQRICKNSRFKHFTHDLNAPISPVLEYKIGEIDCIVNIASDSAIDRSIKNPEITIKNNVNLMLNILEFARKKNVKKFLHLSTDEVYGEVFKTPHKEWDKIVPSNPYSASKAAQEAILISYWRTYKIPCAIVNCQNMFGPMQNPEKFIPKVIKNLLEDREIPIFSSNGKIGARKYIHVDNLNSAILFILNSNFKIFENLEYEELPDRYNVAGHEEINNIDLVYMIANIMGKVPNLKISDTFRVGYDRRYALDDTKLKNLGWNTIKNFEDSLKDVVEWAIKNPEWLQT